MYFHPLNPSTDDGITHPLFAEGVYIKPTTYLDYIKQDSYSHYRCPAWKSWAKNTFVFYAQFDATYRLHEDRLIIESDVNIFKEFMGDSDVVGDTLVKQFGPMVLLWTEHRDIWMEQIRLDREIIPAHFPLGKWVRPILTPFVSKMNETVDIKRGDALWCVRFSGAGENYRLECAEPKSEVIRHARQNTMLKDYLPGVSWSLANDEKRCPFKNLWGS